MVKRALVSGIDWAHAVAKAMAASRFLRTQAALAKKSAVAQSTIGRILRGEVNPQSANLEHASLNTSRCEIQNPQPLPPGRL